MSQGHWTKLTSPHTCWYYYEGSTYRPTYTSRRQVEIVQRGRTDYAIRLYGDVQPDRYRRLLDAQADAEALLARRQAVAT